MTLILHNMHIYIFTSSTTGGAASSTTAAGDSFASNKAQALCMACLRSSSSASSRFVCNIVPIQTSSS